MSSRHVKPAAKLSPRLATNLSQDEPPGDPAGLQAFRPAEEDLAPAAAVVGPADLGAPVTRWLPRMASPDGALASGVWDSTAGTHVLEFDFDEWIHILEGEAHVTVDGETHILRAGDAAFFHAGLPMTWVVPDYVRKVWVHRYPKPWALVRAVRKLRHVARARLGRAAVEAYALTTVLDASASFL